MLLLRCCCCIDGNAAAKAAAAALVAPLLLLLLLVLLLLLLQNTRKEKIAAKRDFGEERTGDGQGHTDVYSSETFCLNSSAGEIKRYRVTNLL